MMLVYRLLFITLGGYIFLGQMVSVRNYRGVVSSRDKIFYVGPSTHTRGYGKFVIARYARFTNSNAKLRLRLRLHLDFLPSLRSGKKPAIRPCAFIRYIFFGQMVSVGNYRGVVSSRDKIFYVGPDKRTRANGRFFAQTK